MSKKKEIEEILDERSKEENNLKEINLEEAQKEDFEPHMGNKKKERFKLGLTIILIILVIGLVVYYFLPAKAVNQSVTVNAKTPSALEIKKLAQLITLNEEYTINLTNSSTKIDNSKIKWTTSNKNVVSLSECSKLSCKIKGETLGETTIKAYYDEQNYDEIIIKVLDSKKIYIYKFKNSDSPNLYASYKYDTNLLTNYKLVNEYVCSSSDCSYLTTSLNNVLIKDNDTFIYNLQNENKTKLDLDFASSKTYQMVEANNKVIGFVLDSKKYYNMEKNVFTISEEGNYVYNEDLLSERKIIVSSTSSSVVYNLNTGSVIKKLNKGYYYLKSFKLGSKIYYVLPDDSSEEINYEIYDDNFILQMSGINDYTVINNNLYLILNEDKTKISKYDANLNYISVSKAYKLIYKFASNYALALDDDDNIILIDDDGNLVHSYLKITDKLYFHSMLSGYYEENGKKGIYIIIGDDSLGDSSNGMSQGYKYYYNPETGESSKALTEIGGYAKPILYLYPTKNKTKVTVTFAHPEYLTTTYPKYLNKWVVNANKDGSLYDQNGKYYYALYWEEASYQKVNFKTGFYVSKDDALKFLEDKLALIGLNAKESNEFIMYWLPVLEKNKQNLVYFELTEERNNFNKLIINPTPDSLLRVAIHIKKVNHKVNINEEILPTFKRTGFTAVEWGGVNY